MEIIKGITAGRKRLTRQTQTAYGNVSPVVRRRLKELFGKDIEPEGAVAQILEDIRLKGDAALLAYTENIDKVTLKNLEISNKQINDAYKKVDGKLLDALKTAAERIRRFHEEQKNNIWNEVKGTEWGQVIRPLNRVGFYIPGGMASYPSTVLATVVPGKVAGVNEAILVTPPKADGTVPDNTIVAADIAGADRIFSIGGAQAIAALAYGTKTVPRVDKICGPGNVFVMLAKKQVFGTVAIDALQGPSEILVIADGKANPKYCAADLLAQAEHDMLAQSVFITTSISLANKVSTEVERQLAALPRKYIAAESLAKNGAIIVVNDIDEAIELANLYAPEHLELMITDANKYVSKIMNAGCVFVGEYATEPIGDYVAGPSHALPTGGTARFSSPLNILDFIKIIDVVKVNKAGIKKLGNTAITIARAEGLEAHARAIAKRLEDLK